MNLMVELRSVGNTGHSGPDREGRPSTFKPSQRKRIDHETFSEIEVSPVFIGSVAAPTRASTQHRAVLRIPQARWQDCARDSGRSYRAAFRRSGEILARE